MKRAAKPYRVRLHLELLARTPAEARAYGERLAEALCDGTENLPDAQILQSCCVDNEDEIQEAAR